MEGVEMSGKKKFLAFLLTTALTWVGSHASVAGAPVPPEVLGWIATTGLAYIGVEGFVDTIRARSNRR